MKYTRLTKEQLEELHPEFINFLATQSIDKKEWDKIKQEKPQVAEQELDVFSELIWEGVLNRAEYLEHFSKSHGFLFHCAETHIHSIILQVQDKSVDLLTREGLQFLSENMFTDKIEIKTGKKEYDKERNAAIFDLIQQGAFLSDGRFYNELFKIINS
ncbi:DUF6495 family protein [Flavobacterium sp.]|uniref:DUF6495 family protein n=1 Tax=Flavobacterium sp. TaxID=239 RepID=UPI0011F5E52B|nr:DUF6495 family protein [Flavobacterium sp.]RZJ70189.1 MAG: hypothetical protein EOO49_14485 [Flavobacterium sp.]